MTTEEIRNLLRRLDGEPADAIESEILECKSWDPEPSAWERNLRDLREAVVCLANTRGGVILLGVIDRKKTRREAIKGVGRLDLMDLRKKVYDGTEPHLLVEIEEMIEPEGTLLLVRVPRGIPPHTTSDGVGKYRFGKECRPLTGTSLYQLFSLRGDRDMTAETIPGATMADLDPEQIRLLQRLIETEAGKPELAHLPPEELLTNLGLLRGPEVTLAAVLMLGRAASISRWAPQHEIIFIRFTSQTEFDLRQDLKGPLLGVLERIRGIIDTRMRVTPVRAEPFTELSIPELPWWAAREGLLNAMIHRDYFLGQSIQVELRPDRLVVSSPGGFIGGVRPDNILRHAPARRNPLLAEVFRTTGLVNRAGMGVDRIYEELLKLGKGMPRYDADEGHVQLTLPTRTHESFARFVAEERRAARRLDLNDLIILRGVTARGYLDRWSAAERLQLSPDESAATLVSLRARGYLLPQGRGRGTSYRLARHLSDLLRGSDETDREIPLDDEAVRLRVQAVLSERGRLTNTDVRRLSGFSRPQVLRLMKSLTVEGLAVLKGRGRAALYEAGPRLPRPRGSARRRRRK